MDPIAIQIEVARKWGVKVREEISAINDAITQLAFQEISNSLDKGTVKPSFHALLTHIKDDPNKTSTKESLRELSPGDTAASSVRPSLSQTFLGGTLSFDKVEPTVPELRRCPAAESLETTSILVSGKPASSISRRTTCLTERLEVGARSAVGVGTAKGSGAVLPSILRTLTSGI